MTKRKSPLCTICEQPCLYGQRDRNGHPTHYSCQLRYLPAEQRNRRLPKDPEEITKGIR